MKWKWLRRRRYNAWAALPYRERRYPPPLHPNDPPNLFLALLTIVIGLPTTFILCFLVASGAIK